MRHVFVLFVAFALVLSCIAQDVSTGAIHGTFEPSNGGFRTRIVLVNNATADERTLTAGPPFRLELRTRRISLAHLGRMSLN
jgi:hypothetical protein